MKKTRQKEKKSNQTPGRNRRIMMAGLVLAACYLTIAGKAVYLQVIEDSRLKSRASGEYSGSAEFREKRGTIYDVNMRELAASTRVVSIGAHPARIENTKKAASEIARHLDMDAGKVADRLNTDRPFVWIRRDAAPERARELKNQFGSSLALFDNYSRVYPNKTLGAQILGFAGVDGNGLEGLEYYYDRQLSGDVRESTFIRDALGRIFQQSEAKSGQGPGNNLVLTIDRNIQYIAEEALKKTVLKFNGDSGMAMVMVPQTGAVRAMAHYPDFNPNAFTRFPRQTWRNRAITDAFEPGSTLKVFLAAAALESGRCSPATRVDCEDGTYAVGGHTLHDIHPNDELTVAEVIKYSSNIGAVKIAERIGAEKLYNTLSDFGFGEKTGIDCPGETPGQLRHYRNWRPVDHATIAFGQGLSVSAVQLLSAVSAIANNGVLMKPRMVEAITDASGEVVQSFEPEARRRVVTESTARAVKDMMQSVTQPDGTGSQASPRGFRVCGKTGTAQILNSQGTYKNCEYNALFVGFAPAESPELAVLVMVKDPKVSHYGGVVAAPAFAEIVRESFNYMNIAPARELLDHTRAEKEGA
ncbi:MAG: penicillin-binding protein 2 [Desulfobacterales bacterium]|nr:penicillin-binding protein 2 [Desulfobacterales bacterium]